MSKKPLSLSNLGEIRKPERTEPQAKQAREPTAKESRGRGRPAERAAYVQLNTRISLETSQQIDSLAARNGWTIREVIEQAVAALHDA
jgi:hypothetical protein